MNTEKLIAQIDSLRGRLKEIDQRQVAIEQECEEKHEGKFTDELRAEYNTLDDEYAEKKAALETAESDLKRLQDRQNRPALSSTQPRITPPGSSNPLAGTQTPNDAPARMTVPATVRRHRVTSFSDDPHGFTAEEKAYRCSQWFLARLSNDLPGMFSFPQAAEFCREHNITAHGSDDGSSHYTVPDEFSSDMINLKERYGVARQLFRRWPMTGDTLHIPRRTGGLTQYAVGENDAITESSTTHDEALLVARKWGVIARYSSELSADAAIGWADHLVDEIAHAHAKGEDNNAVNGDGTSTYGGIVGLRTALNDAAGNPTTTSAGGVVIAAGNAYSEITLANFHSVLGVLPEYADTMNTTWLVHKTFYHTVMEKLMLASGGVPAREIGDGTRGRYLFLGYPVTISQQMPSTAANSQVCALLGDFTLGAAFGDRQRESIMFSREAYVNSQSTFERDQIAVRGLERYDIKVHDVGDSSTAGPIVGLQTLNS